MDSQTVKYLPLYRALFPGLVLVLFMVGMLCRPVSAGTEFTGSSQPFVFTDRSISAPTVPFFDVGNVVSRLTDYKGQVVLVNLWASWCGACLYEMPELDALQQAMAGKGLTVLTLNQDLTDGAAVRRFLDERGFTGLTAHRDLNMLFGSAVGQTLLPMTLLFDTEGHGIGYLVGPAEWNSVAAREFIGGYLPTGAAD
ncbi:MAG: TlpA disulfide reductase family protein [Amphritea sp.]